MAKTQQNRQLAIGTPLGEDVLLVVSLWGTEQLGRPFEYQLELASEDSGIDFSKIVGQNVTLRLELPAGKTRYFNGYVSRFTQLCSRGDMARYSATVVPWLWFLTRTADCRIFQAMTVPDIIKQVFRDAGFSDFEPALSQSYRTWEYCVQYRETAFNFVSRLMEQEGIYYYFKHEDGRHVLVLADAPKAHQDYPGFEELSFQSSGTPVSDKQYIKEWVVETCVQPGSCSLKAFDFKNTRKDLNTRAKVPRDYQPSNFDVYDYSIDYVEGGDGESYARRRIQEAQTQYEVATGTSDARGLCAGYTFALTDHPRKDRNRKWMVTGANYTIDVGEFTSGDSGGDCAYSCSFTAIDATTPFRPARATPRPTIPGPQTAIVVGPAGEEIHVDEYGRVKVQFHWDRYGKSDQNSSCWIRVAQVWAGRQWGAIYTPRIGQEVIVEFLEGDPDHPIITGRVYNGQAKPPYDLPANKTMSTLKSNSSQGGGGFNEIRFEDNKGKEQLFVHAEKDQDVRVKNDSREWIGNERHLIVKKDQLEQVEGDKHSTVKGDHLTQIDGDSGLTVKGDHLTHVSGGTHLKVDGDRSENIGGDQNLKTGMNMNTEAGQKISIKAGMDFHEKAGMNYAMDAGMAVHIKGGMTVVVEGGTQLSLKVGGNFIDINPGGVFIQGTTVLINSGGAAGSGSGSSPKPPVAPQSPDAPKPPKEAGTAEAGKVDEAPQASKPPEATTFSPQATTLQSAAQDGTPFCEECEKAKQSQGAA